MTSGVPQGSVMGPVGPFISQMDINEDMWRIEDIVFLAGALQREKMMLCYSQSIQHLNFSFLGEILSAVPSAWQGEGHK